jgi:coenzyme F420-dependent glucose-6-phosphate dehydrogenase
MIEVGFALSSEEHDGKELVRQAVMAEEAGFKYGGISDHFHPWVDRQGHSPFVWGVLGGIAAATERIEIGTMVTCPIMRTHPAIVAHAAATIAEIMPGRFFLGLGSGENLNEHIVGSGWPRARVRIDMLEEATEIIRGLWSGRNTSFDGVFFDVDNARLYSMPEVLPPIYLAAAGPIAARLAGRMGDGLISTSAERRLIEAFRAEGNDGPRLGQLAICVGESEEESVRLASEIWPNSALSGSFKQELPLPAHFEQAAAVVTPDQIAQSIICSSDPQKHIDAIRKYEAAGFTRVYVHQIGPDQRRFIDLYTREVMPVLSNGREPVGAATAGRTTTGVASQAPGGASRSEEMPSSGPLPDEAPPNQAPVQPRVSWEEATGPEQPPR